MKIFANNFALFLTLEPAHGHFRFETRRLAEVKRSLRQDGPLFDGQVAVIRAADEPGLLAGALGLLQDEAVGMRYAQVTVEFAGEADRQRFWEDLQGAFKPVTAAGGLVTDQEQALLAIFRHGRWDLPKGKVEVGEDIAEAAWREVAEETGLQNHVRGGLMARTYHVFPGHDGRWRLKTSHWYGMRCPQRQPLVPQTEEGITDVRWFSPEELNHALPRTYPQIMELMRLATTWGQSVR